MSEEPKKFNVSSTAYSTNFHDIKKILLKHLPLLHYDETLSQILADGVKIVSKRNITLGNILCSDRKLFILKSVFFNLHLYIYRCEQELSKLETRLHFLFALCVLAFVMDH